MLFSSKKVWLEIRGLQQALIYPASVFGVAALAVSAAEGDEEAKTERVLPSLRES